ncbi:MAG: site-specific DNA-methyltransferase [Candidatus Dormiibacterota bacterium]
MATFEGRLELTWTNKSLRLLAHEDGSYEWLSPSDYRVSEVRLLHTASTVGAVVKERAQNNLLIQGDALNALTSLSRLPEFASEYLGKVKLAYLDPPFNTQQSFLHYDDALEHSVWLTMMRDRLLQIVDLLAPLGSVWVHCDDSEQAYLKIAMDEIFGRDGFVATIVWERRYTQSSDATISVTHDYILVYAKNAQAWKAARNTLPRTDKQDRAYKNPDNDPRGPWKAASLISPHYRKSGDFEIVGPSGRTHLPPEGTSWRYPRETYESLVADNRIWWGKGGDNEPAVKGFLSQVGGVVPKSWWSHEDAGHTDMARREIKDLFPGVAPFDTAKPEKLLQRVIHIGSDPGDIVFDCFVGSGTTAAVAHKMNRRWIGVEREAETIRRFALPRLTKVAQGKDPGGVTEAVGWPGGGGFHVLDVAPSMFETDGGLVFLADWMTNGTLAEATAAQLGFAYDADPPFAGRKGRTRLAVLDGVVNESVVRLVVSALQERERVVICGTGIDTEARPILRELRPGSTLRKIPAALLDQYRSNQQLRLELGEADRSGLPSGRATTVEAKV